MSFVASPSLPSAVGAPVFKTARRGLAGRVLAGPVLSGVLAGLVLAALAGGALFGAVPAAHAEQLTLGQAIDLALSRTNRSTIIRGNEEVASRKYDAKRINFYLPIVSVNGALPSYEVDQSYRFFGASPQKSLYKTSGLGMNSFIRLQQSLLTGGNFSMTANLTASKDRYPDTRILGSDAFLDERSRQGFFEFRLEQPLLKPSTPKNDLADARDDYETAGLTRSEDESALAREVTDAYLLLLQSRIKTELAREKLESAVLQAGVDSSKWQDGVITEEDWLTSASYRLDAELSSREAATDSVTQSRKLALLLDRSLEENNALAVDPVEPEPAAFTPEDASRALAGWEKSLPVRKAERSYERARRAARFAAGGHGLTGDLALSYSAGRGKIWPEGRPVDNINTNGWGVAFNLSYPVWDGGASSASVQAARIQSEQARLTLEKAKQEERAEISRLVEDITVRHRRLEILRKRIDLASQRLSIAEERFAGGRISRIQLLEAKTGLLDARSRYVDELRNCMLSEADLRARYAAAAP